MNIDKPESKLEAGRTKIPVQRLVSTWTAITESLPGQCKKVLVAYKNALGNGRIVLAERYESFTVECSCEYDCACQYEERRDCHYMPAGWWESVENHDGFQNLLITDEVTHWMYMPEFP